MTLKRWRKDPVAFVEGVYKIKLHPWQAEALRAIAKGRRPIITPLRHVGKSWLQKIVLDVKKKLGYREVKGLRAQAVTMYIDEATKLMEDK